MKYGFIKEQSSQYSVDCLCKVLSVSRSGYYGWLTYKPSKQTQANVQLDQKIFDIYTAHKSRYGAPRITRSLQAQGIACSHTRVARRMRHMDIRGLAKRKYKVTTDSAHNQPIFENILNRNFVTSGINQKWVGDITYIRTQEGWLYLAVIIDLHSRAVIGWAMSNRMKKQLVCNALLMALFKRKFPENVIVHSDRGSQYCSGKYRNILKHNQLVGSMSRKGNCWDNAIAESFFHSLKVELIQENQYKTRDEAKQSIFQYVEGYYNQKRLHSAIDYRVPSEVELVG